MLSTVWRLDSHLSEEAEIRALFFASIVETLFFANRIRVKKEAGMHWKRLSGEQFDTGDAPG